MKKIIGLFILVIVLAMVSGCTQQAQPAAIITPAATPVVTPAATAIPTVLPTTEVTPVPTAEPTTLVTTLPETTATSTLATVASTPVPVGTPSTKITTIHIVNNSFVPQQLTVLPGTGITWINDDATVHAIKTTGAHAGMFNSGDLGQGSDWGYTFGADEGTFEILDTYSNATCVIIIKKGELLSSVATARPTTTA